MNSQLATSDDDSDGTQNASHWSTTVRQMLCVPVNNSMHSLRIAEILHRRKSKHIYQEK